jgi:hypothetical protein
MTLENRLELNEIIFFSDSGLIVKRHTLSSSQRKVVITKEKIKYGVSISMQVIDKWKYVIG